METPIPELKRKSPLPMAIGLIGWIPAGYWMSGPKMALGLAAGIFGIGLSMVAIWLLTKAMARSAVNDSSQKSESMLAVGLLFLKFPLIIVLMLAVQKVGGTAVWGFLIGMAGVYSVTVGWAQANKP